MTISRYRSSNLIDNKYQETANIIAQEDLDKIPCFNIRVSITDRMDILAAQYFGDDSYWWVICVMNGMNHGFDFEPGQIIKIPISIEDFLRLV